MLEFFKLTIYYPLLNLLVWLYNFTGSFGFSVIILTILVRLLLFYFSKNAIIAQKRMAEIQPKLKELQEKHKNDKEKQAKALMEFYKTNKINPFSGCLPMLVQLPVLIALYYVFFKGVHSIAQTDLYSFILAPQQIDFIFLGFFDLAHPSKILAVLAGVSQFFQSKYTINSQKNAAQNEFAAAMNNQMLYFFPVMTFMIGLTFPSGLALYWIIGAIFTIIQQKIIEKYYK